MTQTKSRNIQKVSIQLCTFVTILALFITFISCDKDSNCVTEEETKNTYPILEIVNQHGENYYTITSASLVGYDFNSLAINWTENQSFTLDKGMSAGYKDINVLINYGNIYRRMSISGKVSFTNGKTTVITLKGGIGEIPVHLDISQKPSH